MPQIRFGTRGSEVQILSPRPIFSSVFQVDLHNSIGQGVCCPTRESLCHRGGDIVCRPGVGLLGWAAVTRLARVIAVEVPHHVTQRGNARQYILDNDAVARAFLFLPAG